LAEQPERTVNKAVIMAIRHIVEERRLWRLWAVHWEFSVTTLAHPTHNATTTVGTVTNSDPVANDPSSVMIQ
jgi:hypothetical protein